MTSTVNNNVEPTRRAGKLAVVAAKLVVTVACFWYLARQVDVSAVSSAIRLLDLRWAAFATLLAMIQIPLVGLRWRAILDALAVIERRITSISIIAITAIGLFFTQVLPSIVGEGIRAWLLVRRGADLRHAVTSVVLDRGVGVGMLVALGFVILLLPSGLAALGGYRDLVLIIYGTLLLAGTFVLLLLPDLIALLNRVRYLRWLAALAIDARRVLLGRKSLAILGIACLIHALTILIIWSLGRAQGLLLPMPDAAVLFVVMVGIAVIPISINGWGLRELAVVALLARHGISPEQALVFSVCFGLVVAVASLPGALAWLLYSAAPANAPSRAADRA
jgi:glycosyltransferase 2 family protein